MKHSISFESVIENDFIKIPEQYKCYFDGGAYVTVVINMLSGSDDKPCEKLSLEDFPEMKLDTRGWKFNREEANERC